jgi:hypothetical protein
MKIAFYKARKKPGFAKVWSMAIAAISGGPYSHCELVFPEGTEKTPFSELGILVRQHDPGGSLCFSSGEGDGGTRFKLIDLNDGKWDLVDLPGMDARVALNCCREHQFLDYDWAGLRGFVFPWEKANPEDLFCSEAVVECAQWQGELLKWPGGGRVIPGKTSPNDLATLVGLL